MANIRVSRALHREFGYFESFFQKARNRKSSKIESLIIFVTLISNKN